MVDNAIYRLEKKMSSKEFASYIGKLKENPFVVRVRKRDFPTDKKYLAYIYNQDVTNLPSKEKYKLPCIQITIKYNAGVVKFKINNSLRKWYFGDRSMLDFNKTKYFDCLNLLSEKVHIQLNELLDFKITKIEIGLNIKLPQEYSNYLLTLLKHERLQFRDTFANQTVNFRASNLSLIFYDKLAELRNNNKLSSKAYQKLSNNYFFLRIEVRIKKVSGVTFSKENIKTIKDLLNHWGDCFNYLNNHYKKVVQVDFLSPKIDVELQKGKDSLIYDFIKFNGLERISIVNIYAIINNYTNRPSIHRKRINELSQKFRRLKNPSFKRVIQKKLLEKSTYLLS